MSLGNGRGRFLFSVLARRKCDAGCIDKQMKVDAFEGTASDDSQMPINEMTIDSHDTAMSGEQLVQPPQTGNHSVLPQAVHDIASVASIVSLVISIYLTLKLGSISRNFRRLSLVSKARSRAGGQLRNLRALVKNKDVLGIRRECGKVLALAEQVEKGTTGSEKKAASKCRIAAEKIVQNDSPKIDNLSLNNVEVALSQMYSHLNNAMDEKIWQ